MKKRNYFQLHPRLTRLGAALLAALLLTGLVMTGLLDGPDNSVSDFLYQRPAATDGEVVIAGMDQEALDILGPMPWPRWVMADAIRYLNSDPERRPAAIGIDVLFVGGSADPEADAELVEAAAEGGNVVFASAATFGSVFVREGDTGRMDTRAVLAWDAPFDALAAVSDTGHINAMSDTDNSIRHGLLYVDVPGIGRVFSFSRVLYEKYAARHGLAVNEAPRVSQSGFFYIPFTGTPGEYEEFSILDLLDELVDPASFDGKVVLIGPFAAGMQDEYRTSVDHAAPMYGVEIQANVIDAFRSGFYPKELSDAVQAVILFLICFFCLYFLIDRRVRGAVILWLAVCLAWVGVCMLAYRGGLILHVLYVPLAVTILFVATVAVNYIRAQREKRRISDTFGHYVDPAVMAELLRRGSGALELGGKTYDIAVLFVDIRGFTSMSESLDPPTVVEIINRYLTLTTECIMRHHGTLDKFVGDCTMAFWNAPLPQEDPIYLACCAAMDMVEGAKALGQELMERFGRSVSFGVGVHYGPAVVGNIGAPKRMDYTAIGDTVNTASRLESNAPAGTVYISRVVADALGDRAQTTSLGGTVKLKGKAEGFEVLTLDALK